MIPSNDTTPACSHHHEGRSGDVRTKPALLTIGVIYNINVSHPGHPLPYVAADVGQSCQSCNRVLLFQNRRELGLDALFEAIPSLRPIETSCGFCSIEQLFPELCGPAWQRFVHTPPALVRPRWQAASMMSVHGGCPSMPHWMHWLSELHSNSGDAQNAPGQHGIFKPPQTLTQKPSTAFRPSVHLTS